MRKRLYRTKRPIEALGLTIPANSFVVLKFTPSEGDSWYEFLGIFSGLTKIMKDEDVIFDSDLN